MKLVKIKLYLFVLVSAIMFTAHTCVEIDSMRFKQLNVKGKPADSVSFRYDKNGKLKLRIVDSMGVRGFQSFAENAALEEVYFEVNGKRSGKYVRYFTNDSSKGQVYVTSNFRDGKLNGLYSLYRPKPGKQAHSKYDSIVYMFNYAEGKLSGPTYTNYNGKQYFLSYYYRDALLIQYEYGILDQSSYYDLSILEKKIERKGLKLDLIKAELDTWMHLMPLSYVDYHRR